MDRHHVISLIAPDNVASIRVAERLGEKVEGNTNIMDRDVFIYGIERKDWLAARQASSR
jgi:RimJ/RimL family protein N-acetyltransferase